MGVRGSRLPRFGGSIQFVLTVIVAMAMGAAPAAAVSPVTANPGTLQAWGNDAEGQLGIPTDNTGLAYAAPASVDLPSGTKVIQVATGDGHALAVTSIGTVYAWGEGTSGDLGQGASTAEETMPVEVSFPPGVEVASVAAGQAVSYAVSTGGQLYAWGNDQSGQLGNGVTEDASAVNGTPTVVPSLAGVTQVVAGGSVYVGWAAALTSGGEVYSWGSEDAGILGNGVDGESTQVAPTPTAIGGLTDITQLAGGFADAFALSAGGTAYGWGVDRCDELGNGVGDNCHSGADEASPVEVDFPAGVHVDSIGYGGNEPGHGIASDSNGTLYLWGQGTAYSEGKYYTATPFEVPGDAPIAAVDASTVCNYALTAAGTLYANGAYDDSCGFGTSGSSLLSPMQAVPMPAGTHVVGFEGGSSYGADIVSQGTGPGPTVTEVSPASGPEAGGNTVTVRGTGFGIGARVFFGTAAGTNVVVDSAKELTVSAPAGSGTIDVMVALNERNSPLTSADRYAYQPGSGSLGSGGGSGSGSGGSGGSGSGSGSGAAKLGAFKVSGDGATVSVSCAASARTPCAFTLTLTASAGSKAASARRAQVLGTARVRVPAGHHRSVTVALNAKGRQLLVARRRLPVELTVSSGAHLVGMRKLTFKAAGRRG